MTVLRYESQIITLDEQNRVIQRDLYHSINAAKRANRKTKYPVSARNYPDRAPEGAATNHIPDYRLPQEKINGERSRASN
jgi:hypothetical protein